MQYFIMAFFIPSILAGILCYSVSNVLPALIIGSMSLLLGFLSIFPLSEEYNGGVSGSGILFLLTLPLLGNGVILLLSSLIYYITR